MIVRDATIKTPGSCPGKSPSSFKPALNSKGLRRESDLQGVCVSEEIATQLRTLLRDLLRHQGLKPEQVIVLSPYRHSNATSTWAAGLEGVAHTTELVSPGAGQLRVGTIQGFKGLEADVVVIVGIDSRCQRHPATLYVGASRARAALYVLALADAGLGTSEATAH